MKAAVQAVGRKAEDPVSYTHLRTVREVVEEGAQELVNLVKEFEEINAKFAEPMEPEEMDKLIERQGQVQELMDAKGAWDLDSKLEMAMDALRCPPGAVSYTHLDVYKRQARHGAGQA